jgi:hypothetical protein
MKPVLKRLLGATAAVGTCATALLGTGAGTADAYGRAHCDRAEQAIWIDDPSRNLTAHGCDMPDNKRSWFRVNIDTLVLQHHKDEYEDSPVDRTKTVHDRTISCMGYTTDKGTVNLFGCPPN